MQEDQSTIGGRNDGDSDKSALNGDGFPKVTLEQALRIPQAIEEANAGNPYPPIDTATAISMSPGSSGFRTLLAASYRYGFTKGSYKSPRISLVEGGQSAISPRTPDDRAEALVAAALHPDTFRQLFDYYKGKKLPSTEYIVNTAIREFGVQKKKAEKCVEIFLANMRFVGLTRDTKGGEWLSADPQLAEDFDVRREDAPDEGQGSSVDAMDSNEVDEASPNGSLTPSAPAKSKAIFIGARAGKAREQLTKTLDGLGIPYKLAEAEPNLARPISHKVKQTMEACGAGILILTADEEYRDQAGQEIVWRPSDNVVHELGAASILYGDRIVVFKEESVQLASNYSGIGYIEFEKDKLDGKVNDLLRELFAFKIIAVQVGVG